VKFNGFQKMTLLDYPGKVACTLFTAGCNLRCPFCHNASLVTHVDMDYTFSEEEVLEYLKKRFGLLEGVCITGGEPLLQPGLMEFIRKVKELGYAVKLDTNGCFPEKLRRLVEDGLLDYVAMDIKNAPEKYSASVGLETFDMDPVRESIQFLREGRVEYEFRTTVVRELHTVQDIEKIAQWIQGAPRYFLQNFVDSGDLICENMSAVSKEELEQMREVAARYVEEAVVRGV